MKEDNYSKSLVKNQVDAIVHILSDQFAAYHYDATVQPGLETLNMLNRY